MNKKYIPECAAYTRIIWAKYNLRYWFFTFWAGF